MTLRRWVLFGPALAGLLLPSASARADDVHVLDSTPAANATIDGRTSAFSVRFDRPVDHVHSVLFIKRGGEVVETLHPRLNSAPDVLFARASTLPAGAYTLHWQVRTMTGVDTVEGDIPFTVGPGTRSVD
jgi:methionine-rich copper-binding protein CopC